MPYQWENSERMKASIRSGGLWAHILWFLGVVFAILGIIGDAIDATLGLESLSWLMLAVITVLLSVCFFIGVATAWIIKEKG